MKHVFFQFVGLGNLKISGRFRATPTWSSWHSLPGRKLQEPRSTRKINRSSESSEFLPSSFRKSINSVHPKGTPQISPRLASLLAILPWTRHLCRPCHIASNSQPLPAQNCTSESESSFSWHGHMKLGPVLSSSDWPELSRNA